MRPPPSPPILPPGKNISPCCNSKIRDLDPTLTDLTKATEAASITRLESRRESMRTLFEAGQKPDVPKE